VNDDKHTVPVSMRAASGNTCIPFAETRRGEWLLNEREKARIASSALGERCWTYYLGVFAVLLCMGGAASLRADTITVVGAINQATEDGTGPALNNPSLNNILDGDPYTINLDFAGSITSPGTYDLTGSSLVFSVEAHDAVEKSFDSVSLTVSQVGGMDQLSLLACLSTGSGCSQGNELDLNFTIPSAMLNQSLVVAQGIPDLLPLDLLEDDGVTDIHALVTSYSYTGAANVPEPATFLFVAGALMILGMKYLRTRHTKRPH